jgi:hypothetical protein
VIDSQESLVFRDEAMFFNIVQTTPDDIEALDMLKRAKHAVVREKALRVEKGDTSQDQTLAALLSKLADEIKYVHQRLDRVSMRAAIKAVCGEQAYQDVISWLAVEQAKYRD